MFSRRRLRCYQSEMDLSSSAAALLEHLVHQRCLAMVNVGDNSYVSQMFVLHNLNVLSYLKDFCTAYYYNARFL